MTRDELQAAHAAKDHAKLNAATAEFAGWERDSHGYWWPPGSAPWIDGSHRYEKPPIYTTDRNALAELEGRLTGKQQVTYIIELSALVRDAMRGDERDWDMGGDYRWRRWLIRHADPLDCTVSLLLAVGGDK